MWNELIIGFLLYGIGDTITTSMAYKNQNLMERNIMVNKIINRWGICGFFIIKILIIYFIAIFLPETIILLTIVGAILLISNIFYLWKYRNINA